MKAIYRIQVLNGAEQESSLNDRRITYLNAGTGEDSWFNLETARKIVKRPQQRIVEHNGEEPIFEIF